MVADPKQFRKPSDDSDDLRDQIAELQETVKALAAAKVSSGGLDETALERILTRVSQVSAEAQERAVNPSNRYHPEISTYSYPEGDRKRPRALKCPMFWVGYDLQTDTTTAYEIELLNQAQPGTFQFLRTDGSTSTMTVTADRGPDGAISRLLFDFETKERRESLPAMTSMLQQAFGIKTPEQQELERMRAELEAMRAKTLATA